MTKALNGSDLEEAMRLDALERQQITDTPEDENFDRVVRLACAATQTPIGLISLIDSERQWFKARIGMEQGDDKVWRAIADAPFGAESTTRTLGADRVRIATSTHETPRGSRIGRYRPLIVEAFVDDRPVAIARGRVAQGDVAWLDELVVAGEQRGSGVGGAVARAFVEAARDHEATEVRSARGATIAGFLVKLGFSQTDTKEFVLPL